MIIFALLLHLVFLASVFDIYFKSPVVHSARQHAPDYVAPARRLVLFVADGLRADSLYRLTETETPFFRKVIQDYGVWGVSHTRVPTESRPGHVALIAGMFEDPSAITKGWRENPVDFDTLFNQSRYTWSWGSPDILPMFSKGASHDSNGSARVFTEMYESSFEDFSSGDLSQLDTWVFDKVEAFFERARSDVDLQHQLRQDQIVLFLHLLGCDTNGHANKPNSKELLHNIKVLDERVKSIMNTIENFWRRDGRTSYIFTSDHGMTDWGSHGAGLDHETQTPILAWGAGIRQPRQSNSKDQFQFPSSWNLVEGITGNAINQTDVSTLMAALLGVHMLQNSMGKLPLDFLKLHESHLVQAKLANVMQSYEQFLAFQRKFSEAPAAAIFHRPYSQLSEEVFEKLHSKILRHLTSHRYKEALDTLEILHERCVDGLSYYQRYHRWPLYIATTISYVGFVLYIVVVITKSYSPLTLPVSDVSKSTMPSWLVCLMSAAISLAAAHVQNAPLHYAIYYACPFIIAHFISSEVDKFSLMPISSIDCRQLVAFLCLCFLLIELLVLSFFDRRVLSVAISLVCLRQAWTCRGQERALLACWVVLCAVVAAFTFLPTIGNEGNVYLVFFSGISSAIVALWMSISYIRPMASQDQISKLSIVPFYVGCAYLILSSLCVLATLNNNTNASQQQHFKWWSQSIGWVVMVTSLSSALLTEPLLLPRLLALCMGLQSMYLLLSLSYEAFFLLCLIGMLFVWLITEHRKSFAYQSWASISMTEVRERRVIVIDDIWRAVSFLFFSIVSFFGTGNLASINSFDPKSIRTLVSVFNPFLMGGLLLLKVLVPFLVVACFLCAVRQLSQMPSRALFLLLLLFSDLMGLHFFFLVTDRGSWLEIGTSLSHFVIAEGTVIFLQLFFLLAKHLLQADCIIGRRKMMKLANDRHK